MLELGGAFSAGLAVRGGRIVDGLGGSAGPIGARACGALDAEVAYLLGGALSKRTVFSGVSSPVIGLMAKAVTVPSLSGPTRSVSLAE